MSGKPLPVALALIVLSTLYAYADAAEGEASPVSQIVPGEYLVRRAQGQSTNKLLGDLRRTVSPQVQLVGEIASRGLVQIRIPSVAAIAPADRLAAATVDKGRSAASLQSVAAIEPVVRFRLTDAIPTDVARAKQSTSDLMTRISLRDLPGLSSTIPPTPIVIAVIDSGVLLTHKVFNGLILNGTDVTGGGSTAAAVKLPSGVMETHGTGTAGLIAMLIRGGTIDGPPRANIRILPIRATSSDERIDSPEAIKAIDYAISQGASIINVSWGDSGKSTELQQALMDADAAKITVVASAGNGERNSQGEDIGYDIDTNPFYPASWPLPNMVTVAALGLNDALATFSNWGHRAVRLAAPGESIFVPTPIVDDVTGQVRSGYQAQSGTSISAPLVSGSLALFKAGKPKADRRAMVAMINQTVSRQGALAAVVSSGGLLSVDTLLQGQPSSTVAASAASLPHGNSALLSLPALMTAPISAGSIVSDAPVLRGNDARGSDFGTSNLVRMLVRLSPNSTPGETLKALPSNQGVVKSVSEVRPNLYNVEINTPVEKKSLARTLLSLPGVQSTEEVHSYQLQSP